ncbi:MAG: PilZ domain-containing protein [Phycisphaerales bacterium]
MSEWFDRLRRALSGETDPAAHAQQLVAEAYQTRARIELIELSAVGSSGVMVASIEAIDSKDSFIINQPSIGARTIQLPRNMECRMTFRIEKERWTALTRCLNRARVNAGSNDRLIYGYRLAMPSEVNHSSQQRAMFRIRVGIDLAPSTALALNHEDESAVASHIEALIDDLSVGGMMVRTNAPTKSLAIGQRGTATFELPEPVGKITACIEIRHIQPDSRLTSIGIEFCEPIEGLGELIRALELKRARRARRAS